MSNEDWSSEKEPPGEMNQGAERFSVDVLIHDPKADERTVGFYDYLNYSWLFLGNEKNFIKFNWRYFDKEIDAKK